jgi:hypothetical protein
MGAFYAGRCYESGPDAERAALASVVPVVTEAGAVTLPQWDGESWTVSTYSGGALVSSQPVPALSFAPCSSAESVQDGVFLGFMVVLAWTSGFAVRAIRGAL